MDNTYIIATLYTFIAGLLLRPTIENLWFSIPKARWYTHLLRLALKLDHCDRCAHTGSHGFSGVCPVDRDLILCDCSYFWALHRQMPECETTNNG